MTDCKARQCNEQMQCGKCGLAWDVNDQDPPQCRPITYPSWAEQDRKRREKTDRHVRNAGKGPEKLRQLLRELRE